MHLKSAPPSASARLAVSLLLAFLAALLWSAIGPHDYFTWLLEVLPAIAGIAILAFTFPRFQFSSLVYSLVFLHSLILLIGGHYTYAQVPLFNWIRDTFGLQRNYF